MVKRSSGFSPQKDVRRSTRDRSAVYRSLAENNLANQHMNSELMKKILRTANESREQEQEPKRLAGYTRSGRKLVGLYNFGSSEDDDDEPSINQRTRSSRNSYPDENDVTSPIQKSRSRQVKRRRVTLDDELDDEDQNNQDGVIRDVEDSKTDNCMYDRIKRSRHQNSTFSSADASRSINEIATSKRNSARNIRLEKKRLSGEPKDEEDPEMVESSDEEDDEEEDNKEPRQYALRKNRNPVERFMFGSVKSERPPSAKFREEGDISRRTCDKRRERSSKLRGELRYDFINFIMKSLQKKRFKLILNISHYGQVAFFMRKGADCLSKWVGEAERQLRLIFIVIIGATNRLDTLDPALRRPGRFDRELKFSLPDANARYRLCNTISFYIILYSFARIHICRLQILEIHTSKWGNSQPNAEMLKWLAESTSGYCGADLQYLCTESVLIALRARYPHIYMSNERLALDPSQIRVILSLFTSFFNAYSQILFTLYLCNFSVRLLICGTENAPDNGQTSYILPALLGKLDHLPVFSVSVARLFSEGRPEEALAQTIQSTLRAASSGPCILLLPSVDQWYNIVPPSVAHMLLSAIDTLNGFSSILFLSTCDSEYHKLSNKIKEIFRPANCVRYAILKSLKYFVMITYLYLFIKDKTIRHHAIALRDMAEELFDAELEEDFVELLENHAKMLLEANVKPKNEKLLQLPKGFERKTRWTVTNGYMTQIKPEVLQKQTKVSVASVDKGLGRARFRTSRKGTYNFPNQQKRKKSAAIVKSIARSLSSSKHANQVADLKVNSEASVKLSSKVENVMIKDKTEEQNSDSVETKAENIDHNQDKANKQLILCDKELQAVVTMMDFQNRAGGKTGGGGVASAADAGVDRRERLRWVFFTGYFPFSFLKDVFYLGRNQMLYHQSILLILSRFLIGSYLAHTQGKKHQSNLARRAAKEAQEQPFLPAPAQAKVELRKFVKIGRPGYKVQVTRERDAATGQQALLFQIDYPEIAEGVIPRHRFMSAYEQKIQPPDKRWQYLLFAAEPYETIAFKIPSREVDKSEKFWTMWNKDTKQFFLQVAFRIDSRVAHDDLPPAPPPVMNAPMASQPMFVPY
uniref:Origin recognition complex subunit 2 n=1 Tax=Heterorhabditis bacteriophora TaxID=37862 RepID=A0A1I7XIW8_HETBA